MTISSSFTTVGNKRTGFKGELWSFKAKYQVCVFVPAVSQGGKQIDQFVNIASLRSTQRKILFMQTEQTRTFAKYMYFL